MYKIFELPKTEKEVGKLYSRSVKNSSFREEFLKRFKERMDVVHLELAQIFPEIKFDYSIKSLEECEKCVDAYLEQVSQLSQRIEQHTHWWTLPVEVKSIAFDMGLYTSLIVEKHSHNLDKWNWEYGIPSQLCVLSFNLAGTKFTSSKFPRKEFILSGSVKSEISQFDDTYALSQLKIGSSEWIKKLLFGCRIKTEWKFFNIPEINEYNILNIHFYISTEIEILSFDQQISSVYIFCKQENGKLHIFDQKGYGFYGCLGSQRGGYYKDYNKLNEINKKILEEAILGITGVPSIHHDDIPKDMQAYLNFQPIVNEHAFQTQLVGFYEEELGCGGPYTTIPLDENKSIIADDGKQYSHFGRKIGTSGDRILYASYHYDFLYNELRKGCEIDGANYKAKIHSQLYKKDLFEDTGYTVNGLKVFRAFLKTWKNTPEIRDRYEILYSSSMTLHDFVDQDITLFIKTPLNLYIEVTKTEITEKKDTSKYKEIVQGLKSQSIFTLLNFLGKK